MLSVNEMIEGLEKIEDIDDATKLHLFIQLCNEKVLMNSLKKQTMMLSLGMATEDPIYTFVYAILRIAKPHLFEGENNAESGSSRALG